MERFVATGRPPRRELEVAPSALPGR